MYPDAIYHVMFRGNRPPNIFKDARDRERLLECLGDSAATYQVDVYLYCLMSNHVHLLVCTPLANLDRFMGSLLTGYTVYFNRRHDTVGHLLQGRYKAQVVAVENICSNSAGISTSTPCSPEQDVVVGPTRHYRSAEMVWASVLKVCRAVALLLRARQRGRLERGLMAWALQRYAGLTQRQIAARLGLSSGAAVSLRQSGSTS